MEVLDPPRAGLEPPALDAIVRMQPPTLVYVTPFDLFPQAYHIESISWFRR